MCVCVGRGYILVAGDEAGKENKAMYTQQMEAV